VRPDVPARPAARPDEPSRRPAKATPKKVRSPADPRYMPDPFE
jgi:hypothetical protein